MTGLWRYICPLMMMIFGFSDVEVEIEKYPWQAALYINGKFVGGATIIGPKHILTSARLVFAHAHAKNRDFVSVVVGRARLTTDKGEEHAVQAILMHPQFQKTSSLQHNLAILKLTKAINFDDTKRSVQLPKTDISVGTAVTTTGWYKYPWETVPVDLKEYDSKIISNTECDQVTMTFVNEKKFTPKAKLRGSEVCTMPVAGIAICRFQGNIGSPLVHQGVLVGINSWGGSCDGPYHPIVYSRISKYVRWIKKTMKNG